MEILGRYRLERRIGAGAFGEVHLATLDGPMGFAKSVAIKVLARDRPGVDPVKLGTFVNEALLGENLHHPNIAGIHEFGEDQGRYFLVMEYIDGINLQQVASLCAGRGVVLPPDAVCELGVQVCAGLQHAHAARDRDGNPLHLVHRDLKPANLLLDRTGTVRVGDFGVARAALNPFFTTTAGEVKGTPRYMAPEQVAGEAELTGAVDLYSLGLVLCELATGQPVYAAERMEALLHQVHQSRTGDAEARLAAVAPELAAVVSRALAARPQERYVSAAEMGAALRQLWMGMGGEPRMEVVAAATLGLRAGQGGGKAAKTAQVPVMEAVTEASGPWARFTSAFGDQLEGVRVPEVIAEQDEDGAEDEDRRIPLPLLAVAVVASLVAVAVVLWSFGPRETTGAAPAEEATPALAEVVPEPELEQPTADEPTPTEVPVPPAAVPAAFDPDGDEPAIDSPSPAPSGPGRFKVNSTPWSEVWVDGRRVGDTGEPSFEVPAGRHEVRLVRDDSEYTIEANVPQGATVDLGCWDFRSGEACFE